MRAWPLVGSIAILAALAACDSEEPGEQPLTPVRVEAVQARAPQESVRYSANIQPQTSVDLAFKVSGYVKELLQVPGTDGSGGSDRNVQAGDSVAEGTVLAKVDPQPFDDQVKEAKAQLASADAALKKADADFKRATALYDSQSMTAPEYDTYKKEFESAQAGVAGAKAQLDNAKVNLGYTDLKAPLSGVILQRNVEVGTLAAPDSTAFVIADTSSVKAVFGVPDVRLKDVKLGDALSVTNETYPDRSFAGKVTEISPAADSATRVFNVEITLPNSDGLLKAGMVVSLALATGPPAEPLTLVPLTAVVRGPSGPEAYAVYVVVKQGQSDVARLKEVQLGQVTGNEVAVTDGLEAGEQVIVTGATLVGDGKDVKVIP
jgi:multidrug efflux system membrane fusion protein